MKYVALLVMLFFFGCKTEEKIEQNQPNENLNVLIYEDFQDRELWSHAASYFKENYNCQVNFTYEDDILFNLKNIFDDVQTNEVIIGVNSAAYFSLSDTLFADIGTEERIFVSREMRLKGKKYLPICYNYLSFLYNEEEVKVIPQTFGVIQDAVWSKQIIMPNPENSSIGRAFLLWSISLFDANGLYPFCRSLRGNILGYSKDYRDGVDRLFAGETNITLGFPTEIANNNKHKKFAYVIPKESYFRYMETAAISKYARNKTMANLFIKYLINDEFQNYIIANGVMFPTNKIIRENILKISIDRPSLNSKKRLDRLNLQRNYKTWLKIWKKTMKI